MPELHALLVGIDRYDPGRAEGARIPDLQACVRDVERMEAFLLAEPIALPPGRIRKLVSPLLWPARPEIPAADLPTYGNLLKELEALCTRAERGDQVVFHYSGHGARLPTVAPAKKGVGGKDECLVPCDAGGKRGGFLRDLEIHALLQRLAARSVQTTLILDCCHSGGITRELPRGQVRGLGEVTGVAPGKSLLGSWDELAALLPDPATEPVRTGFRNLAAEAGWFPQPEGCVLLAACRPTELAREYPFDGGGWSGALTHFLLQAVGDLGSRPTYRWLHHRLLGRIRGQFDTQTPLLEGDGELRFLGRESWPARRGIAVLEVQGEGSSRRVQLAAGRAQALGPGARLAVAARDGEGEAPAELEVTELGASVSWARVVGGQAPAVPVEAGDLATVVHPGAGAHRCPVLVPNGAGASAEQNAALDRLRQALESGASASLLAASENGTEPEYRIAVTANGAFEILDSSEDPIPHQGRAIPAADPDSVERLLERLAHLASYKERERLANPGSPLAGKLRAELFALESLDHWQDPEKRHLVAGGTVPASTLLCLIVRNDTGRELNFAVLDLQPDWGISQVHPGRHEGAYTVLEPGAEHPVFFRAGLPDWMAEGRDHLKVIATTGPLDVSSLELPALGESAGFRSLRRGSARDLREQLFSPADAGAGFRMLESITLMSYEWVVETVEVRVARPSRSPQ